MVKKTLVSLVIKSCSIKIITLPPVAPVSVSLTALAGSFTSGFASPQAFGFAFIEPCRSPRRVPEASAPMGGVHTALAADAQFASRRPPARSGASFSLIRVSSRTPTFWLPHCCTSQNRSLVFSWLPSLSWPFALYDCMYWAPYKSPSDRCTFAPEYGHGSDLPLAPFPRHCHCQILQ
jgi:hypothetical protein